MPGAGTAVPPSLAAAMRAVLPTLSDRVTTTIQGRVEAYAGPAQGRRHRLIRRAVTRATEVWVDRLAGRPVEQGPVDELFWRMGHGEALDGHDLAPMLSAYDIATRDAWHELHVFAVRHGLPAETLGGLGDALFAYMEHLTEQVTRGHHAGRAALADAAVRSRRRLLGALLRGAGSELVTALAADCGWTLPDRLVVSATTQPLPAAGRPAPGPELLVHREPARSLVLCAPEHAGVVSAAAGGGPVVRTWAVPPDVVPQAVRWARLGLRLVADGVLPSRPVVDLASYRTDLWLHGEPELADALAARLLAPLAGEGRHQRQVLEQTLATWLATRPSAPALAALLGVHPQTARQRMRRLHALFGDDLADPETSLALLLVLRRRHGRSPG